MRRGDLGLLLAGPEGAFVTGASLKIDGGFDAWFDSCWTIALSAGRNITISPWAVSEA